MSDKPTLKVMRVYKPGLHLRSSVPRDPYSQPPKAHDGSHRFSLSQSLMLPDSFGSICLGETFSAYIRVINTMPVDIYNVSIVAVMEAPSGQKTMQEVCRYRKGSEPRANPRPQLAKGESMDVLFDHFLQESASHVLRVYVTYNETSDAAEKQMSKKFYRFNVINPFRVTITHNLIEEVSYVTAELKNLTKFSMFIDQIEFVPRPMVQVEKIKGNDDEIPVNEALKPRSVSDIVALMDPILHNVLNPEESLQYLFKATISGQPGAPPLTSSIQLGHFDISWKTSMGETGRMVLPPVIRKPNQPEDVQVKLLDLPCELTLNKVYKTHMTLKNCSTRTMKVQIQFHKDEMSGVFCSSVSRQILGVVPSQASLDFFVNLLPLIAGLHEVKGLVVTDVLTGVEYKQGKLQDVFIQKIYHIPKAAVRTKEHSWEA